MQKIIFGISLDASTFHEKEGVYFFGQKDFLRWLEQQLGFAWPAKNYQWLRTTFFRKVLFAYLAEKQDVFFANSFEVDSYGATEAILALRDELRLALWNFESDENAPKRLKDLSDLEAFTNEFLIKKGKPSYSRILNNGFADRFIEVESDLDAEILQGVEITLVEPLHLLPVHWQRFFKSLMDEGVTVLDKDLIPSVLGEPKKERNDLGALTKIIQEQSFKGEKVKLKGDGSLLIYQVPRDYDGIESISFHYQSKQKELPFFIMPPELKLPDLIFESDGLPVSGNSSVSDLRPSQQLIKLAHSFLWFPVDLGKILEFLNLPYSPLHNHLSARLGDALQQRPGFDNDNWAHALSNFQNSTHIEDEDKAKAMFEYRFWFERKTYSQKARVPKAEVFSLYQHLVAWAKSRLGSTYAGAIYHSIYRLSLDLLDLLDALEEETVSLLELEKLTQIVIQATPATFKKREVGASNFSQNPGAIVFPAKEIIWFNFVATGNDYIPTKCVKKEIDFLTNKGVILTLPASQNKLRRWMRYQPFYLTQDRLIFVVPEKVEGKYADKHPLHFELEAMIENIEVITVSNKSDLFAQRPMENVLPKSDFYEPPLTQINPVEVASPDNQFSVTGLETFLYYPHTWVLRKQMKLYGSSLKKIKEVNAIMGNIAHKAFELMMLKELHLADNEEISEWFGPIFMNLIKAEGLPFLEYGKEPDLAAFRKKLFLSLLSFVHAIRENGWKVVALEETLTGKLGVNPIKGITDVVLERNGQFLIVDLKWGGKGYRKLMFKNKEDIQLMLYAKYFGKETEWLDTCFYIIKDSLFLTRQDGLFKAADLVPAKNLSSEVYDEMYGKLLKTLDWRFEQLKNGQLELRITESIPALDELYGDSIFELLPQRTESYMFDDFGALLGEVDS